MQRRTFLTRILSVATAVFLLPLQAFAAAWNQPAFEAEKLDEASKHLAINQEIPSLDITITAPDRAENGAVVQVEITSQIVNTESIALFVEKNPTALIGHFKFSNNAQPFVITRIKMAEDSDIKVIVKAGEKYYTRSKKVVVLENGCG